MEMYLSSLFYLSVAVSEDPLSLPSFPSFFPLLDSIPFSIPIFPIFYLFRASFLVLTFCDVAGYDNLAVYDFRDAYYPDELFTADVAGYDNLAVYDFRDAYYPKVLFTADTHLVPPKEERRQDETGTWHAVNKTNREPVFPKENRCDHDYECWWLGFYLGENKRKLDKTQACCCQQVGFTYGRYNKRFRSCMTKDECKDINGVCVSFFMWFHDNETPKSRKLYNAIIDYLQ